MRAVRAAALAVSTLAAATCGPLPAMALEPYQMMRSLQLVQDRIAGGDHAALPMQQKLLEMIDQQLRTAPAADFADRRNFVAVLLYGMSGGNPITVDVVLSRLGPEADDLNLSKGIAAYLRGDLPNALVALDAVDPRAMVPELGAFVALIKGSILTTEQPAVAVRMFDQARLLGSGTLVEEAALRRSLALAVRLGDTARFLRAADQYVRRFLRSPYASQFADALVAGIAEFHDRIDLAAVEMTISGMSSEHQKAIYLRLARTSAIEGLTELAEFASRKATVFEARPGGDADARATLYSSLTGVTSATAADVLQKLRAIDRAQLSAIDRQLLDAAISVASGVISVPGKAAEPFPSGPEPRSTPEETALSEPSSPVPPAETQPTIGLQAQGAGEADAPIEIVRETRRKLEEIDKLLMDTQ